MNFSLKRVNALVTKEFRDFYKNPNVLLMMLFSIGLTIFYRKVLGSHDANGYMVSICLSMNITTVGCLITAMLIAEEKEKNTLRTLMLTPLTTTEFIVGKFVITAIIIVITNIVILFILKVKIQYFLAITIISLFTTVSILFIGALIGIFSKDQMQTGTIGTPFYMILLIVPIFSKYNSILSNIANFLPTYHGNEAIRKIMEGQNLTDIKYNLLALVLWIVVAFIIFKFIYGKKRVEE